MSLKKSALRDTHHAVLHRASQRSQRLQPTLRSPTKEPLRRKRPGPVSSGRPTHQTVGRSRRPPTCGFLTADSRITAVRPQLPWIASVTPPPTRGIRCRTPSTAGDDDGLREQEGPLGAHCLLLLQTLDAPSSTLVGKRDASLSCTSRPDFPTFNHRQSRRGTGRQSLPSELVPRGSIRN